MLEEIVDDLSNKNFYEDLMSPENKVDGGWLNENGYISDKEIEDYLLVQKFILHAFNFNCTLMSAEYYWSDYCQTMYHASWIQPNKYSLSEFAEYLKGHYYKSQ